jgi:hypothetical protein
VETAGLVFDDPLHASKPDPHPDGDRWQTIGRVGPVLILVVHTWPEELEAGEPVGRIISARKACLSMIFSENRYPLFGIMLCAHERRAYAEGSL